MVVRTCFIFIVSFLFLASCGNGTQENHKDSVPDTAGSFVSQDTANALTPSSTGQQIAASDSVVLDTGEMMKTLRVLDSIQKAKKK